MRKSAVLQSLAVLVGVLLMMAIAYWHSIQVSRRFDDAMHRDIQQFSETLAHSQIPKAQGRAVASILTQVHHNTLSYVSSQTDSLIGTIAFTGILVMAAVLGLAGRFTNGGSR
jgi:hypothetical protein